MRLRRRFIAQPKTCLRKIGDFQSFWFLDTTSLNPLFEKQKFWSQVGIHLARLFTRINENYFKKWSDRKKFDLSEHFFIVYVVIIANGGNLFVLSPSIVQTASLAPFNYFETDYHCYHHQSINPPKYKQCLKTLTNNSFKIFWIKSINYNKCTNVKWKHLQKSEKNIHDSKPLYTKVSWTYRIERHQLEFTFKKHIHIIYITKKQNSLINGG